MLSERVNRISEKINEIHVSSSSTESSLRLSILTFKIFYFILILETLAKYREGKVGKIRRIREESQLARAAICGRPRRGREELLASRLEGRC